jgi:hypothetical protein
MWITMLAGKREAPDGFDLGSAIDQMWLYMPAANRASLVHDLKLNPAARAS